MNIPTRILIAFFVLGALALPVLGFAHEVRVPYWGPLLSCGTVIDEKGVATNPCTSLCDLVHTAQHFIYFGITLALVALAPPFFAWGGIMILTSGGSEERLGSGKKILTGTVIGIVIVLAAFLIVNTFISLIGVRGVIGWGNINCSL
ncbi:hypothetical protein C4571_03120 [Candidatus Parcubacteria bacterium]|nr:MAG: hypothetical protein C4571_03120 [Candidatus Parcubacteria bacterium]